MSLLPGQILPPSVAIGRVNEEGTVILDKNWWLFLYNIAQNVLGTAGGLSQAALQELAGTDSDAMDTDAVALRQRVSNALVLSQAALTAIEQVVNQSVDSNASPKFLAVQLGSILKITPMAGFLEFDGNLTYSTDASLMRAALMRTLFTQTTSVTVANTVTETTLIGSGIGTVTLPANYGFSGKTLMFEGFGYHSATAAPTIRIRIYKGTTVLLDTGAQSSGNSTNALIQIRAQITWRSSTSVSAQGFYQEEGTGTPNNFQMVNTAPVTVNATSEALSITVQWGTASASNTITLSNLSIRESN